MGIVSWQAKLQEAEGRCAEAETYSEEAEQRLAARKQNLGKAKQELIRLQKKVQHLTRLLQQTVGFRVLGFLGGRFQGSASLWGMGRSCGHGRSRMAYLL